MKNITFVFLPLLILLLNASPTVACEDLKNAKSKPKVSKLTSPKVSKLTSPKASKAMKPKVSKLTSFSFSKSTRPKLSKSVDKTRRTPAAQMESVAKKSAKSGVQAAAVKKKTKPLKTAQVKKGFYFVPLPPKKVAGDKSTVQKRTTSSVSHGRVAAYFKKDRIPITPNENGSDDNPVSARLVPTTEKVGIKHSVHEE
jgi:hypothetical protein